MKFVFVLCTLLYLSTLYLNLFLAAEIMELVT